MSCATKQQHFSVPKGICDLELFHPERLKDLDDEALDVELHSVDQFIRSDSLKFVLEVALERKGCLGFLLSCKLDIDNGQAPMRDLIDLHSLLTIPRRF